jgi:hypothetical protein
VEPSYVLLSLSASVLLTHQQISPASGGDVCPTPQQGFLHTVVSGDEFELEQSATRMTHLVGNVRKRPPVSAWLWRRATR